MAVDAKTIALVQETLRRTGDYKGKADGIAGPLTRDAIVHYKTRNGFTELTSTITEALVKFINAQRTIKNDRMVDTPVAFPHDDTTALTAFYGKPGTNQVMLTLPLPFRLAENPAKTLTEVTVNKHCHDAFKAVWTEALDYYGEARFRELRLDVYGGCYNNRAITGGVRPSTHAFACAWDVDPANNTLNMNNQTARLAGRVYVPFWQIVEKQGGLSLGRRFNYDWMHFQFAYR